MIVLIIKKEKQVSKWPTKAVSTSEAMGSAAKANAAGSAIDRCQFLTIVT